MPIKQNAEGKWQWGEGHGSFDTREEAERQQAAAYAQGWKGEGKMEKALTENEIAELFVLKSEEAALIKAVIANAGPGRPGPAPGTKRSTMESRYRRGLGAQSRRVDVAVGRKPYAGEGYAGEHQDPFAPDVGKQLPEEGVGVSEEPKRKPLPASEEGIVVAPGSPSQPPAAKKYGVIDPGVRMAKTDDGNPANVVSQVKPSDMKPKEPEKSSKPKEVPEEKVDYPAALGYPVEIEKQVNDMVDTLWDNMMKQDDTYKRVFKEHLSLVKSRVGKCTEEDFAEARKKAHIASFLKQELYSDEQKHVIRKLGEDVKVIDVTKDGDITLECEGKKYILRTNGQIFAENDMIREKVIKQESGAQEGLYKQGHQGLIPKKVNITRGGRTFQQTIWVNAKTGQPVTPNEREAQRALPNPSEIKILDKIPADYVIHHHYSHPRMAQNEASRIRDLGGKAEVVQSGGFFGVFVPRG
jgi:hypothetical protein